MIEADGGSCDTTSFKRYNGGFHHTDALASGAADVATLIFANFEMVEARARGLNPEFFSLKDWGVPDFCQLVLFTTPERFRARKDELRKLVLAMRRATRVLHQEPARARAMWAVHLAERARASATAPRGFRMVVKKALKLLNPLGLLASMKMRHAETQIVSATLPAFPNDNSIAADYFDELMGWLVRTKQVEKDAADAAAIYWTNEVAL